MLTDGVYRFCIYNSLLYRVNADSYFNFHSNEIGVSKDTFQFRVEIKIETGAEIMKDITLLLFPYFS